MITLPSTCTWAFKVCSTAASFGTFRHDRPLSDQNPTHGINRASEDRIHGTLDRSLGGAAADLGGALK
jgi:hypothetical protein